MSIVYPNGSKEVTVTDKIAIFSEGSADVYYKQAPGNVPQVFNLSSSLSNEEVVLTPGSTVSTVRVDAGPQPVYYETGAAPVVSRKTALELVKQGAPTAKTTSATLTTAEVKAGIITVNQGAGGASAQQLPLASAMDTGFPDVAAGYAFDFSVINISTVDAEDASVTTNTGWTLVGSMDIPAYSAAGSLNSSARFRARKTDTATWVLYRIS